MSHAAQHHHGQNHDGFHERERFRRNEALERGEHTARHTTEGCTQSKSEQLHVTHVNTHCLGRNIILTQRHPCTTQTRILQTIAHENRDRSQNQEQIVIQKLFGQLNAADGQSSIQGITKNTHGVNAVNPTRAVGQVELVFTQVIHENTDDFTEAQSHERQIIATQFQNRRTEHNTGNRRQASAERNDQQQRNVQAIREMLVEKRKVIRQMR